ncbi:DUF2165 domain-containing protein [Campylobacter jejuni]|nr:hypothetical protein [Campylobacter jejuni]EAI0008659.1 hypothetical protein [Campylobacter jejuni]EAI0736298.1 hypothetical protein [Campylobacter jejuni]EAI4496977.1 DUF2165 domain-containing protein [Campylobacter jejuni]EAJ2974297.1 DUF2165 domain-containing protein [Campylobacter jejuni]
MAITSPVIHYIGYIAIILFETFIALTALKKVLMICLKLEI